MRTVVALASSPEPPSQRWSRRLHRERRLRGSAGSHAPQSPVTRGTPPEEPQPRIVTRNMSDSEWRMANGE
jgi:hypothetical protein